MVPGHGITYNYKLSWIISLHPFDKTIDNQKTKETEPRREKKSLDIYKVGVHVTREDAPPRPWHADITAY